MFSTILVPVDIDHSDWAKDALRHVDGVDNDKVRIVLLHVIPDLPGYVTLALGDTGVQAGKKAARRHLDEFAVSAGSNLVVEIGHGRPASQIIAAAERLGADLIVIGSHAPDMVGRLLGSTATRVVRDAKCSVLVSR